MRNRSKEKTFFYVLLMPVLHCFGNYLALFIFGLCVVGIFGSDLGSVVVFAWVMGIFEIVYVPFVTIRYCKRIRHLDWKKYLCCLYNALIIVLPFLLEPNIVTVGVAVYALLCGLFALLYYHEEDKSPEPDDGFIGSGYLDGKPEHISE